MAVVETPEGISSQLSIYNILTLPSLHLSALQQSRLPGAGLSLETSGSYIPPPPPVGHVPNLRLRSEIPNLAMEPPPCVQNAMMKQDKKPFTYTPGGIDLSEIRSPRMARRIERNANYSGVPEAPRSAPQQPVGPLPPSALAAMQPQMHVQVFPSGPPPPPPPSRSGAPPPPPPPMANMPPPPPPPLQPLPTQKVVTSENQVLERPDMTKIIPDNPMALLRKTGGPKPRNSFVEEMYENKAPAQQVPVQPPQHRWSPPAQQRSPPVQQQPQPSWSPPSQQVKQERSPPIQQPQPQWAPQKAAPQPAQWSPPIIERSQPERQLINGQKRDFDQPMKTSTAHLGSLYIPPINQQQKGSPTPPSPPKRDLQSPRIQSPSTPTLKEAPRPWQRQPQQQPQQELPPWAKREPAGEYAEQPVHQSSPAQPQRFPQTQARPSQQQFDQRPTSPMVQQPQPGANVVFVTQPLVFQHPGGPAPNRQQQQSPKVDIQGSRVVPVQVQAPPTPKTPGNERSLNRQQSWSNNPTQSNSFKLIQKITNTDGDEENDDQPIIEHAPKYTQQFQQAAPVQQMRKLQLADGDRELMNRFKQEEEDPRYRGGVIPSRVFRILDESGVDDDNYLHNEVDPRYRGPAIPSKAFKLLQSMTDGSSDSTSTPAATVSHGSSGGSQTRQPQVRTIPIQIERDDPPKNYVPPSEQTVTEPKKYTGSSIPSRSFKILQAMTAPDSCANANEVNENYDPSSYSQWGYDPHYPNPYPPYWHDYYYSCYPQPQTRDNSNDKNPRQTPVPFWGYPVPCPPYMPKSSKTQDVDYDNETARNTPVPYWGYYPYGAPYSREEDAQAQEESAHHQYPYYWDPYYYAYYYGYPPAYSPYPYYGYNTDSEDYAGYSSTDEISSINKKMKEYDVRNGMKTTSTPTIIVTPTCAVDEDTNNIDNVSEQYSSDSESEPGDDNVTSKTSGILQTIKSVTNIKIYEDDDDKSDGDDFVVEENSEEADDDSASVYVVEDDTIPHQLSVIYEVSEKTDPSVRESSVLSDSTTIADRSDSEDEIEEKLTHMTVPSTEEQTETEVLSSYNIKNLILRFERNEPFNDEINEEMKQNQAVQANISDTPPTQDNTNETEINDLKETLCSNGTEEEDWWGILKKDDDPPSKSNDNDETGEEPFDDDDDASSASSSDSSSSQSTASKKVADRDEDSSDSEEEREAVEQTVQEATNTEIEIRPELMSIRERIEALKESIRLKQSRLKEEHEVKPLANDKITTSEEEAPQNHCKALSTKSSLKSYEECSEEEEGDSGVTSDLSRHISDNEEFPELKKMTRYQRAATHSRLFKLLQEECDEEDDNNEPETDKFSKLSVKQNQDSTISREHFSLPLKTANDFESFSSSGITSPGSPVSDRLVNELVQSMLKRKKGELFKNVPKEKLQAAAKKILQEEFDDLSTPDSSFLSPLRSKSESSTPAQTPQEFYYDYKQYYDSWSEADRIYKENYDILPSKAFKLLQEHSGLSKTGAIAGLLAKCPKILSSKNVHQELLRLIECSESPSPDKSLEPSEVTNAS